MVEWFGAYSSLVYSKYYYSEDTMAMIVRRMLVSTTGVSLACLLGLSVWNWQGLPAMVLERLARPMLRLIRSIEVYG